MSLTAVNWPPISAGLVAVTRDPRQRGTALIGEAATDVGIAGRLREERRHADAERKEKPSRDPSHGESLLNCLVR